MNMCHQNREPIASVGNQRALLVSCFLFYRMFYAEQLLNVPLFMISHVIGWSSPPTKTCHVVRPLRMCHFVHLKGTSAFLHTTSMYANCYFFWIVLIERALLMLAWNVTLLMLIGNIEVLHLEEQYCQPPFSWGSTPVIPKGAGALAQNCSQ